MIQEEHAIHSISCATLVRYPHRAFIIATMEPQIGMLSTLENVISVTSFRHQYDVIVVAVIFL